MSSAALAYCTPAELAELDEHLIALVPDTPASFGDWLKAERPEYKWTAPHFRAMQEVLDDVTAGKERRAFFQIPIRHGKSEHNTVRYAAYRLKLDPRTRILVGSYNQQQVNTFSRAIRRIAREIGVVISDKRDAIEEWETEAGGGVRAVGAGSGVASVNADLILIDDPIGARKDAESLAHRDRVWDWITSDLLARAEPHTAVLFTMSRWHQDDPAGRLRDGQAGEWRVLDLPARAEKNDALGRAEGEALWPEFRNEQWLMEKQVELGEFGFASLLQGRPRPREGGMLKWEWWKVLDVAPVCAKLVRYWDLAGTEPRGGAHDPDFSAGTLAGRMSDGRACFLHQAAFRHSIMARDAELERIASIDRVTYGNSLQWWIETEAGIAGVERTAQLVRRLQMTGLVVKTEHPTGSKVLRAEPLAAAAESGNVCLGPDDTMQPWRDALRLEASGFPNGIHDDRVDSAAGAYNKLAVKNTATSYTMHI